jgi:hypothetical protein
MVAPAQVLQTGNGFAGDELSSPHRPLNLPARKGLEWTSIPMERTILGRISFWKGYGFAWVTGGFFVITLTGHWIFGWFAYVSEQIAHNQPIMASGYLVLMSRDTLENWQSEFLQLVWQVMGLALLLHVGSPQSKEGDDRVEAKIDALLELVGKDKARALIEEIDERYAGRHTDPHWLQAHRPK